ncbi:hypothetical protein M1432_00860 [Patescibacteria group bacterium]|nr:hypothetical protein [Patescibacteria group bacterium]
MPEYKYLITLPVEGHEANILLGIMDAIANVTGLPAPYSTGLGPHLTFHRPIQGLPEKRLIALVHDAARRMKPSVARASTLYPFGKQYVVMPVYATRTLAKTWLTMTDIVFSLPEYIPGTYDDDNMLHITLARHTSRVFDTAWPLIRKMYVPSLSIPLRRIEVYRKPVSQYGKWERVVFVPFGDRW